MKEKLNKLDALKAETLVITDRSQKESMARKGRSIVVPAKFDELLSPIPYIIPAQLFAACLAAQKGLNPDEPRTLQKVTRTM